MRFMRAKYTYLAITNVGTYAIDYLTVTTFNESLYRECRDEVAQKVGKLVGQTPHEARYMQYIGEEVQGVFFGEALQNGQLHFMIVCKGGYSSIAFPIVAKIQRQMRDSFRCTKIDLQVTSDRQRINLKGLDRFLRSSNEWRGRKLQIRSILNSDGLDSLYLGNQLGETHAIIYIKEFGDNERGTRFEAKYKGEQADFVFTELCKCSNLKREISKFIKGKWRKYPKQLEDYLTDLFSHIDTFGDASRGVTIIDNKTMERRFRWFVESVVPAIETLLKSQYHERTMAELQNLLKLGHLLE